MVRFGSVGRRGRGGVQKALRHRQTPGTLIDMIRWVVLVITFCVIPLDLRAELSQSEQQADEAFQRGMRLYQAEDYLAAAREFERAYRIVPIQSVHYNIARSYELAEMPERAAQHYRAFMEARAGNPERRNEVRQRLSTLSEGLSWVSVATNPQGATLFVDGEERGVSPTTLAMTPGRHVIDARHDEGEASRAVEAGDGETSIMLSLVGGTTEPPIEPQPTEQTSPNQYPQQQTQEPEPRSVRRLHHGFFWAGLGLTIGSGVALTVVGMRLLAKRDEYNDPENEDREEELREEGQQLEVITTALWVTTGVLALTTALFAIFTDWSRLRRGNNEESYRPRWALGVGQGLSMVLTF